MKFKGRLSFAAAVLAILPVSSSAAPIVGQFNIAGIVTVAPLALDWGANGPPTGPFSVTAGTSDFSGLSGGGTAKDLVMPFGPVPLFLGGFQAPGFASLFCDLAAVVAPSAPACSLEANPAVNASCSFGNYTLANAGGDVALGLLLANVTQGQDTALPVGSPVAREIGPGESHDYTIRVNTGDLVAGVFDLRGVAGALEVRDPANTKLKTFVAYEPAPSQELRVGFLAFESGTYRIQVTTSGTAKGSYVLRMDSVAAAKRMLGVRKEPSDVYPSERIRQLAGDVQKGQHDAVGRFWREVMGKGPLVEPLKAADEDVLVTFLWKAVFDTQNVLVVWPAGYRADEYYMSHLAGTDVWYKTIRLRRGSRFTYMLSPNDRAEDRTVTEQMDPLNPRRQPEEVDASDSHVASVLELPGAPDESWVRRAPATRGVVEQKTFQSGLLKGTRDIWIYAPPGYAPNEGPYPLVVLFDGRAYIGRTWDVRALNTLDNLINEKRIRPAVVCFIDTSRDRVADLNFGDAFASAVADELLPMLRSSYAISSASRDVVIGGYSLGGLAASFIALKHPELVGNVLPNRAPSEYASPAAGNPILWRRCI